MRAWAEFHGAVRRWLACSPIARRALVALTPATTTSQNLWLRLVSRMSASAASKSTHEKDQFPGPHSRWPVAYKTFATFLKSCMHACMHARTHARSVLHLQ